MFNGDRMTDANIARLINEPQQTPVRKGPVTFCPNGQPGILAVHNFRTEAYGPLNKHLIDKTPSLYAQVYQVEISRMEGHPPYFTDYSLHFDYGHSVNALQAPQQSDIYIRDPRKPSSRHTIGGVSDPWRGNLSVKENAYEFAEFLLFEAGLKAEVDYIPPFAPIRALAFLGRLAGPPLAKEAANIIATKVKSFRDSLKAQYVHLP